MPNFIIFGVGKAGTSSVHNYISQHPDIFMSPVKEPNFFLYQDVRNRKELPPWHKESTIDLAAYQKLFAGVRNESAIGESSISYFESGRAAERIKQAIPACKLVAILRHPVERAYSAYLMWHRDGFDSAPTFEEALRRQSDGSSSRSAPTNYRQLMYYAENMATYYNMFPSEQIIVLLYDDLKQKPEKFFKQLFSFLNVDPAFMPDISQRENIGGIHKSKFIGSLFSQTNPIRVLARSVIPSTTRAHIRELVLRYNLMPAPRLSKHLHQVLTAECASDIRRLEKLTNLNLSHWLS